VNQDSIEIDWPIMRDVAIAGSIDAGGEDMNAVSDRSEPSAQGVHGINRPAIAIGRDIGWSNVENSHLFRVTYNGAVRTTFQPQLARRKT
jgi:hypothetical protein